MDVNQLFLLLANALTFATAVVSLLHVASEGATHCYKRTSFADGDSYLTLSL